MTTCAPDFSSLQRNYPGRTSRSGKPRQFLPISAIIDIDCNLAAESDIAGGKGSNTHILRRLNAASPDAPWLVPRTRVLTAQTYRQVVLADPAILRLVCELDRLTRLMNQPDRPEARKAQIWRLSEHIRHQVEQLTLPDSLVKGIAQVHHELGTLAVRSSATLEDLRDHATAGLARSYLNVTTVAHAVECVKKIWASLFSEGFVEMRCRDGFDHCHAEMAVLLQQQVVDVSAAGVITSVHASGRPCYVITAQLGLGVGVVDGQGRADTWIVGLPADGILERSIRAKETMVVPLPTGGIDTVSLPMPMETPALPDVQLVALAQVAHSIAENYRYQGLAEHVDIEFVTDIDERIHVVQTRPQMLAGLTQSKDEVQLTLTTVDIDQIPNNIEAIRLNADLLVAQPGAAVGTLRCTHSPTEARPDDILLTHHTNNEWAGAFSQLAGVMTMDGNSTSHAAKNAQALGIPCVTQLSAPCFDSLRRYEGHMVTLDAEARTVYAGGLPLKQVVRDLRVWRSLAEIEETPDSRAEEFRHFEVNQAKNPGVFLEDLEGRWRRRSHTVRTFQLDYYDQAWDRLTSLLNTRFGSRQTWRLEAQRREVKRMPQTLDPAADQLPGSGLLHLIEENAPPSIFDFLAGVEGLDLSDMRDLIQERRHALADFEGYVSGLNAIDASNVVELTDRLVDFFAWMHFAYWLNISLEELFVARQVKYLAPAARDLFGRAAMLDEPVEHQVDLTRERDSAVYAFIETAKEEGLEAFFAACPTPEAVAELAPHLHAEICGWSARFKMTSEHIQRMSDTEEYLRVIANRMIGQKSLPLEALVARFRRYARRITNWNRTADAEQVIADLRHADPELYSLLRGYACTIAQEARGDWMASLPQALGHLIPEARKLEEAEETARRMLADFPRLRESIALSWQETVLREDGHHYAVRYQRVVARLMLDVASRYPDVFGSPDEVFDVSTAELAALFFDPNFPSYIPLSFSRWSVLEAAQEHLCSPLDRKAFEDKIERAIEILDNQQAQAQYPAVRDYYRQEKTRLQRRLERFRHLNLTVED